MIMSKRFTIGQELTSYELQKAYTAIRGSSYPRVRNEKKIARELSTELPDRFEFEINKIRGFAWER